MKKQVGSAMALLPLGVFLLLFLGSGIITGDFYNMPVLVAIFIASITAIIMNRKESIQDKIEAFASGAGKIDIIMMVFIFILAGAFSATTKAMGAVESTVNLALTYIPQSLIGAGLFIIAAFISIAMGTSMGTIAALAPIGVGLSDETGISVALTTAAIIGGSMFGDNLSFISDTTIAAVRTQQTKMRDKFRTNFLIVLPAAIVTIILLFITTLGANGQVSAGSYQLLSVTPYLTVLVAALSGFNVFIVLTSGIVLAGIIGIYNSSLTLPKLFQTIAEGMLNMGELAFLAMMIGGTVEIIRRNGGIDFLLELISRKVSSKKGAELGIAGLVSLTNFATANNTISILTAGPLAKNIANEYNIDNRKSASILDIFSCSVQGIIPYGAQVLTAAKLASISPTSIIPFSFYPIAIAICGILAILFNFPRFKKN